MRTEKLLADLQAYRARVRARKAALWVALKKFAHEQNRDADALYRKLDAYSDAHPELGLEGESVAMNWSDQNVDFSELKGMLDDTVPDGDYDDVILVEGA
jgi:hypothetical protein